MPVISVLKKKLLTPNALSNQATADMTYSLCLYDVSNTVYCASTGSIRTFTVPLTQKTLTSTTVFAGTNDGVGATPVSNQTTYTNNRFFNISCLAMDSNKNLYVGDSNGPTQVFSTQKPTSRSLSIPGFTSKIAVNTLGSTLITVSTAGTSFTYYSALGQTNTLTSEYSSQTTKNTSACGLSNLYWIVCDNSAEGKFIGGSKISSSLDYLMHSFQYVVSPPGYNSTTTKWTIDTVSNSAPIISGSEYPGQIYSAAPDSNSNFYFIMMPLGSSNVSNIEIKFAQNTGAYTLSTSSLYSKYIVGAIRNSLPIPYVYGGWDGVSVDANSQFFLANPAAAVSNYYPSY